MIPETVPCADLLNQIAEELREKQEQIDALDVQLGELEEAGVYLHGERTAVPSLSEKKHEGRVVGYYLVYPTWYANAMGISRRKYTRKGDVQGVQDQISRTKKYARLQTDRQHLQSRIENVRRDLNWIVNPRRW